jgi:hypothetical protein
MHLINILTRNGHYSGIAFVSLNVKNKAVADIDCGHPLPRSFAPLTNLQRPEVNFTPWTDLVLSLLLFRHAICLFIAFLTVPEKLRLLVAYYRNIHLP